jgi:hypothetical protein
MTSFDTQYFEILDRGDLQVVLLIGEKGEQWSSLAEKELVKANVPFVFLPWSELCEARKSGEWVRYPILEHWKKGQLRETIVGFSQEKFRRFSQQFARGHLNP